MWLLKKGGAFLPRVSLERLNRLYAEEKEVKAKLRLLVAIRRKKGESIDDIASALEKPRRTIHGWLRRLEQRGLSGAVDKKQTGRVSKLSESQLRQLRRELLKGPAHVPGRLWTMRLVREHIASKYGVVYKRHNIFRLLRVLGFSVQKPRQRHFKADAAAWERFKKKRGGYRGTSVVVDGRSRVWTSAVSTFNPTSRAAGH